MVNRILHSAFQALIKFRDERIAEKKRREEALALALEAPVEETTEMEEDSVVTEINEAGDCNGNIIVDSSPGPSSTIEEEVGWKSSTGLQTRGTWDACWESANPQD